MNSYKLGIGLVITLVMSLGLLYIKPKAIAPRALMSAPLDATTISTESEQHTFPFWQAATNLNTFSLTPHEIGNNTGDTSLASLFADISNVILELSGLQRQVYDPLNPNQQADELMAQTYQPRIDELSQRLEEKIRKAEGISKPQTQRFIWEQALMLGLEDSASSQAISVISSSLDNAVFEDMLMELSNSSGNSTARSNLAFLILYPPETTYYDANSPQTALHPATPRQQRIQQFLEEQFLQETTPEVLHAYLEIYHTMSQDQHGLVPAQQFQQQLEILRPHLAPDQYFNFRLQQAKLQDPEANITSLLQEMSTTSMTPAQRQSLQAIVSNNVFSALSPNAGDSAAAQQMSEQHRQILLQYLETGLIPPKLHDRFSLYEYGNQVYAIELLKHREQAAETYYQRIVDSKVLEEQLALLLGSAMGGDVIRKKLQQNAILRQKFTKQLNQPNLSADMQTALYDTLQMLNPEPPPIESPPPVDENGNTLYYINEPGITSMSDSESTPYNEQPAAQYPGY